jgi:hypothetical protein
MGWVGSFLVLYTKAGVKIDTLRRVSWLNGLATRRQELKALPVATPSARPSSPSHATIIPTAVSTKSTTCAGGSRSIGHTAASCVGRYSACIPEAAQ